MQTSADGPNDPSRERIFNAPFLPVLIAVILGPAGIQVSDKF